MANGARTIKTTLTYAVILTNEVKLTALVSVTESLHKITTRVKHLHLT